MRFTWTFLAGAAILGAFALFAQIPAPVPARAQFSSAPGDAFNPISRLPDPPKPGASRVSPTARPVAKTSIPKLTATPIPRPTATPIPTLQPRFVGQNPLRVGLSTAGQEIKIYFPGGATVYDSIARMSNRIRPGDTAFLAFEEVGGPAKGRVGNIYLRTSAGETVGLYRVYFAVQGEAARVSTNGANPKYSRPYRGDLEVFPQQLGEPNHRKGPLALVNIVPLEAYLRGVVPWEMGAEAPPEALKAQAICARTKTLDFVRTKRFAAGDFDVCDYDACQGYPGMENEKPVTTRAVEETKGLAIYHGGRPIDAVYSTNSGGITAGARDVWPGGAPIPYLQSVADAAPDSPLAQLWNSGMNEAKWAQFCAENFDSFAKPGGTNASSYETSKYRWTQFVSVEDASKAFAKAGFGAVSGLEVSSRAASGRIKQLKISGFPISLKTPAPTLISMPAEPIAAPKTLILEGDGKIRAMFSKQLGSTTALPSSLFTISPATDASGKLSGWNLQGAGWGHGVGMCQRGAQNHAKAGWDARKILNWYYRGVEIR